MPASLTVTISFCPLISRARLSQTEVSGTLRESRPF